MATKKATTKKASKKGTKKDPILRGFFDDSVQGGIVITKEPKSAKGK